MWVGTDHCGNVKDFLTKDPCYFKKALSKVIRCKDICSNYLKGDCKMDCINQHKAF